MSTKRDLFLKPKNNHVNNKNKNNKNTQKMISLVGTTPIMGKGDFRSAANGILNALKPMIKNGLATGGGMLGGKAASYLGIDPNLGSKVGTDLARRFSKLIGTGDYTTNSPSANCLMKPGSNGYPVFENKAHSLTFSHREYLEDILTGSTAGAFNITSYAINPGLAFSFPYLASIAQNFEEYRIDGMVYEFVSTTSPYNTNSAMGSVIMSAEYNAATPAFTSKPQMENSDFAISARFDKDMIYGLECADQAQSHYYVRSSASTLPLTTTDVANLFVATAPSASFPTNANVGELWVSYTVTFFRPRISQARFGYAHFTNTTSGGTVPFVNNTSTPLLYGTLTGATAGVSGGGSVNFPNATVGDTYILLVGVAAATSVSTNVTPTSGVTGFSANNVLDLKTNPTAFSAAATTYTAFGFYTVTANNPTLFFNTVTTAGTTQIDVLFIDVGNGFTTATL